MTPTLEDIQAAHDKVTAMLAEYQAAAAAASPVTLILREAVLQLAAGERYCGLVLNDDGNPSHHLILLPDEPEDELSWTDAKSWAQSVGGELPTRNESALLYANARAAIEAKGGYWTSTPYGGSSAWIQNFFNGYQGYLTQTTEFWARSVRRLPL